MARGPFSFVALALAAIALAAGGPACAAAAKPAPAAPPTQAAAGPEEMSLGDPKAKVTVIEYASASCPHCARFNNNVFPEFKKKYVDTGQVRYVLREFLTQPVQVAAAGFLLARCAGPAKYFQVIDDFFHGQAQMYETGDAKSLILAVGAKAGLTEPQIEACLSDETAAQKLNQRVARYVQKDKVQSTPTFVVNGRPLPELDHEVALADLDAAIGPLLTKPRRR